MRRVGSAHHPVAERVAGRGMPPVKTDENNIPSPARATLSPATAATIIVRHHMGAQLWHYQSSWHEDPADALDEIQVKLVSQNYDLERLLSRCLEDARNSIDSCVEDGDPYDLIGTYQEQFDLVERLYAEGVPKDVRSQIEIIRRVNALGGVGVGNILDLTGISSVRDTCVAELLGQDKMLRLLGNSRPTVEEAEKTLSDINEELNRGECICFPIYDVTREQPIGWYFVGNTID